MMLRIRLLIEAAVLAGTAGVGCGDGEDTLVRVADGSDLRAGVGGEPFGGGAGVARVP